MFRYKNNQPTAVRIPHAGDVIAEPGEEYDSENEIVNPTQEPVNDEAKAAAAARASQSEEASS